LLKVDIGKRRVVMELNAHDMSLLLAGLKAVSLNNSYTSDQRRGAKELEDCIGNLFTTGVK
jgi:hypothetical protein